jgi:hypothetical protein
MEFFNDKAGNHLPSCENFVSVPDVTEWMYSRAAIVDFCQIIKSLKEKLAEAGYFEEHFLAISQGKMVLSQEVISLLQSTFGDEYWEYLQNYLL